MSVRVYGVESTVKSTIRVYGVQAQTAPSPYFKHYGYVAGQWVPLIPQIYKSGAWVPVTT